MSARVLHIINGLSVGGAEMMLYKLLATMDRSRFAPVVVSLTGDGPLGPRIGELGVTVKRVQLRPGPGMGAGLWRFWRIVRDTPVDLIQGWQYHGSLAARLTQALLPRPVPMLWNIRHSIADLREEPRGLATLVKLGARCSHRAERIIYAARASALQHEALGYRADRRVVLPNGFDTDRFVPSAEARLRLRRELGLAPSALIIGKIARYHRMKDHAGFLRAANLLGGRHPDVHFVLAGDNVDRANAELVRLIGSPTLAARTHLLGRRDDAHTVIAALDILTSAAAYGEAFPNVLGEAMACAVPCVATDVGDSALIVGDTGEIVPPRQPAALAAAWMRLIEMGPEGRIALGRRARRRILDAYALRSVVARYEALYDEVLGRPTPPAVLEDTRSCVESPGS